MKSNVSEDRQTILRRRRHSRFHADEFPMDLIIEIFSRLPVKCIARCRCVSKLWASILGRPDFTETFLTRSSARRKLLFICKKDNKVFFLTSPQPQNLVDNRSTLAASYHMEFLFDSVATIYSPISGFVCIQVDRIIKFRKTPDQGVAVICNPSTGQSFTLPKMKTRKRIGTITYLSYDPIEKQHKVLAMTTSHGRAAEHQVLTLGTGTLAWRLNECSIPHYSPSRPHHICINGVLYYATSLEKFSQRDAIVSFDVRSEKYNFIETMERVLWPEATLVKYNGKLGTLQPSNLISGTSRSFEMWVLEDPEKHEWSKHIYILPPMWKYVVAHDWLRVVGVTDTNDIVLSRKSSSDPFYVYYYNFERETIRRVQIRGMGAFEGYDHVFHTYLNHVEDVKLM